MDISILILAFAIGTIAGSFLNMLVYRIPAGLSIVKPGSFCPNCQSPLSWSENVPLISFLLQKGRCKHCQKKISNHYFLIELFSGLLSVGAFFFSADALQWIYLSFMIWLFIALIHIDITHYILPDKLIIAAFIATAIYKLRFGPETLLSGIPGALITALVLYALRRFAQSWYKKEAFGFGDVKLGALIGFILGWPFALLAIFFGFCLAALFGITMISIKKLDRKSEIPFGPFMIGGLFVFSIWGPQVVHWYMHLLSKG